MPKRYGLLHIGFLSVLGVGGWAVVWALTLWPQPVYRSWEPSWELGACLVMVGAARLLAFRAFRRVRIALDSAFYVACAFVFGTIAAAWLVLVALTIDMAFRIVFGSGPVERGESPARHTIANVIYNGGLPALVLCLVGLVFNDAQLYPAADLTLDWKVPLFSVGFLVVHYFLAGGPQWFQGSTSNVLFRGFFTRAVTAELTLVPLSLAMVLAHMHQGIGLFLLLGATGLLFNAIFRRGATAADKLRDRISELATLNKVGSIIAGSLERDTLLENLSRETLRLVRNDSRFMVGLIGEHQESVNYEIFNESGERYKQVMAPVGEGLSGWVMRNRRTLNLGDLQKEWPLYLDDYNYNDPSFHSWLGVPLIVADEVIGVLVVQTERRYAYTLNTMRVLTTIADQAAVAIENAKLYELATVDGLTGLYVRRYFDHRVKEEWGRSERYGVPFSVGMFDLDDFKKLNDAHGHQTGDQVLIQAAAALKSNMRSFDVAARYGGEEFAFILPRTDLAEAQKVAERVRKDVEKILVQTTSGPVKVTTSIGIAGYAPDVVADADDLVARADEALYRAKKRGKNCVIVADTPALAKSATR